MYARLSLPPSPSSKLDAKCPPPFEKLGRGGGCYYFSLERMGWIEAKKQCELMAEGARLAAIQDTRERDALLQRIQRSGRSRSVLARARASAAVLPLWADYYLFSFSFEICDVQERVLDGRQRHRHRGRVGLGRHRRPARAGQADRRNRPSNSNQTFLVLENSSKALPTNEAINRLPTELRCKKKLSVSTD